MIAPSLGACRFGIAPPPVMVRLSALSGAAMPNRYFSTLARYNAWANRRLYDAVAMLPEAEYMKSRPAFFHSIHGTLNHILVGDRIWLARIEEKPPPKLAHDQILYG